MSSTSGLRMPGAAKRLGRVIAVAIIGAAALGAGWPAVTAAADPGKFGDGQEFSIHYQDAVNHASDAVSFTAGDAVSVPFTPRAGDTAMIGGSAPVALPAGSATGKAMAASPRGSVWAAGETSPPAAGSDFQIAPQTAAATPKVTANASGNVLKREVYGFLPYWNVGSYINYDVVSTIAYFGVDLFTNGDLNKTYSDGSPTRGWRGWTSQTMTDTINAAHAAHDRVVLTIESFAWDSAGATAQTALLSDTTARTNAVKQIVAAVRDRGADGVNLDFEPIASGQSANFTTFMRQLRIAFDAIHAGYEITFCATGHMGNYDPANMLAAGAADNVFIMGYDFRTGASSYAASMDPLTSPRVFDLTDAVTAYKAKAPASKILLGLPYYGIAYSTPDTTRYATNVSGTTYGAAVMSPYETAATLALTNLKQYDPIENSAWVSYYGTYGGTSPTWRELYYDDVQALGARYDRINYWGLGGAGIWALGYDTNFPELNQLLADKFLTDHNPPKAGITNLATTQATESFTVGWTARDDWNGVATYDVQMAVDGGAWTNWITGANWTSSSVEGKSGHNYSFRVRATDGAGNVGPWDVTTTYVSAPTYQVNGYAVVTSGPLNERGLPTTSAGTIKTAPTGTVFQIIGGPVTADGYTWYQVNGPISELGTVTPPFPGAWVAVSNGTTNYMAPVTPPNTTLVSAPIANFGIGRAGSPTISGVSVGRTFSPDGDGIHDTVAVTWTNTYATDSVTVNVIKIDGTSAGSIALGSRPAGANTFNWNGRIDGTSAVLPDGQYLLQVVATVGSSTYYGPSAAPFDSAAWNTFGTILDTTPSGTYFPLAPIRILDTRNATGLAGAFNKDQIRSFAVAGHYGVPAGAIAVTGNLTVTQATSLGFVTFGPSTATTSSTINFNANDNRANGVTVGLAADGSLSGVYRTSAKTGSVQLVFDLSGYFIRDARGATFVPVTPTRIVDTRQALGVASGPLVSGRVYSFAVGGLAGVPSNAVAVTGNATVTGQSSNGKGFVYLAGSIAAGLPPSSTLNFVAGDTRANNVTVPVSGGKVQVEYSGPSGQSTQFIFDITGYFVPDLTGATFVPLTPGRIVDTRTAKGFAGPVKMGGFGSFAVRGQVSVKLPAVAVVGNLTVTAQTSAGWLNAAPAVNRTTSTLNFPKGQNLANGFVSMLGSGGTLTVTFGGPSGSYTTQVVVDIVGYYR